MPGLPKTFIAVGMLLAVAAHAASATTAPSDPCSLLPAATVGTTLGSTMSPPHSSVAPRPYANTVMGTDCVYKGGGQELLFRIYFDPSSSDATGLFARLKMFYSPATPGAGVGDEAYMDRRNALNARKGNVRFFLQLNDSPAAQKPITALANIVAGQL